MQHFWHVPSTSGRYEFELFALTTPGLGKNLYNTDSLCELVLVRYEMHLKEHSLQTKDIKLLKLACLACLKHLARAENWNFSKISKKTPRNFRFNCSEGCVCQYGTLLYFKAAVCMKKETYKLRKAHVY